MLDDTDRTGSDAAARIVAQVRRGGDVAVSGERSAVSAALAAAEARLGALGAVIRVASGTPLSLSGLIAQLSGVEALDEQDDGVLSAGLERVKLAGRSEQSALVLDVPAGMRRTALRFLRQVMQAAPAMRLVITQFDGLAMLLAEPGMLVLQQRLSAVTIEVEAPVVAAPMPAAPIFAAPMMATAVLATPVFAEPVFAGEVPAAGRVVALAPVGERAVARAAGRGSLWAGSAAAMAASLAIGAWLGSASLRPSEPVAGVAHAAKPMAMPIVTAGLAAPVMAEPSRPAPAEVNSPAAARVAGPVRAGVQSPGVAQAMAPTLAGVSAPERLAVVAARVVAALPPRVAEPDSAEAAVASPVEDARLGPSVTMTAAMTVGPMSGPPPMRRRLVRATPQERRVWPARGQTEPDSYEPAPTTADTLMSREVADWPPPPPRRGMVGQWRGERTIAPESGAYIGTYGSLPDGERVFRYER